MTDGHLTDEQLSSHLDGMSDADRDDKVGQRADEHLAGCVECRHRLAGLEAARDLVRAPVPPLAPEVRAASITSVLQAAEEPSVDTPSQVHPGGAPVPMRTPRRPGVLVGSAAAALVLAVGVPLALLSHASSSDSTASAPSTPSASGGVAASAGSDHLGQQNQRQASGTTGVSGSAHAALSDLGVLDSLGELRSRVTTALSRDVAAAPSAAAPPTTGPAPTGTAPTSPAPTSTGAFASTAPTSTGNGSSTQSTFNVAAALQTAPFEGCLSSARHAAGSNRSVQFLASAEFRGVPALVYVFLPASGGSPTGNGARSLAVATARHGCRVLGTTTL